MEKVKNILIASVVLLILFMGLNYVLKLTPTEVKIANRYLISMEYSDFTYDVSFTNQLKSNTYDQVTLSVLNILASQGYDFRLAREIVEIVNLEGTALTRSEINTVLDEMDYRIGFLGIIIGYSINFVKWFLLVFALVLIMRNKGNRQSVNSSDIIS
ncbi:MAG: hypothetical protein LCH34_14750 [Firmicutes bacterium]|nr:hypothetical protein [Bacillota bacterium]